MPNERGASVLSDARVRTAIAVLLYGAAFVLWSEFHWGGPAHRSMIADLAFTPVNLVAAVLALVASRRVRADHGRSRAWLILGVAFALWWAGDLTWCVSDLVLHSTSYPGWSDLGYLSFYPVLLWGLLAFPAAPRQPKERLKLVLDAATVVVAGAMVVWFVVIGPTTRGHSESGLALVVSLAYPVGDLVLLFGMGVLLLRHPAPADRAIVGVLMGGVGLFVVGDLGFARLNLTGSYQAGSWPDACWMAGQCLMAVSAVIQHRHSRMPMVRASGEERTLPRISRLPYVAVLVGVGLMSVVAMRAARYPLDGLVIGTVALALVVITRQLLAQRENQQLLAETRRLAAIDALTGLTNRRSFFEQAEIDFAACRRQHRPLSALMIDVDHFKTINDTHGHAAGDMVLHALGLIASQQLRGTDTLSRYGGDEFVALLPGADLDRAVAVAQRLGQAVAAEAFQLDKERQLTVTLSIGVANAEDCASVADLLRRADDGLYQAKWAGRACVRVHSHSTHASTFDITPPATTGSPPQAATRSLS